MSTTSSTSTASSLAISGLASGFDWQSLVTQLIGVERAPETTLHTQQSTIQNKNNAYGSIVTQLGTLKNSITTLTDPTFFDSRLATPSDSTVATATSASGSALGNHTFAISQMATNAVYQGALNAGKPLSATNDVSGLTLSSAGLVSPITAGTFSINGQTVTIATSDTLQGVFDKISTATGGNVTGSYDSTTDEISLNSSSAIVLGSATDTSNFLQATKLYNNGTGNISSTSSLGGIQLTSSLASSNFATAVNDGGSGAGSFLINGVQISYNATNDSLNDVLTRINDSGAGVTASYDTINDRVQITNKTTGDMGISLQDTTGNFLAATGLTSGTLQHGKNLQYTIDGGSQLTSLSNTISQDTSGLTGLSVTALKTGTVTVGVASDVAKIESAVSNFVTQYNAAQKYISSQIATSTDSTGKVTAGTLTGETDVNNMATQLRQLVNATPPGLTGLIHNLNSLGINSNGNDNSFTMPDATTLEGLISSNLNAVKSLFTDSTNGLATKMSTYLDSLIGTNGTVVTKQTNLTKQSTDIDNTIATMERKITDDQSRMTDEFVAMETAQAKITQQQTYLTKAFP